MKKCICFTAYWGGSHVPKCHGTRKLALGQDVFGQIGTFWTENLWDRQGQMLLCRYRESVGQIRTKHFGDNLVIRRSFQTIVLCVKQKIKFRKFGTYNCDGSGQILHTFLGSLHQNLDMDYEKLLPNFPRITNGYVVISIQMH